MFLHITTVPPKIVLHKVVQMVPDQRPKEAIQMFSLQRGKILETSQREPLKALWIQLRIWMIICCCQWNQWIPWMFLRPQVLPQVARGESLQVPKSRRRFTRFEPKLE